MMRVLYFRFSRHLHRPGGPSRTKKGSITIDGSISLQPTHRVLLRRKTSDPDIHHLNNGEVIGVGSPTNGHCHKVGSLVHPLPVPPQPVSPSTMLSSSPLNVTGSSMTPRSAAITIPQMRSTDTSPQPSPSITNSKANHVFWARQGSPIIFTCPSRPRTKIFSFTVTPQKKENLICLIPYLFWVCR